MFSNHIYALKIYSPIILSISSLAAFIISASLILFAGLRNAIFFGFLCTSAEKSEAWPPSRGAQFMEEIALSIVRSIPKERPIARMLTATPNIVNLCAPRISSFIFLANSAALPRLATANRYRKEQRRTGTNFAEFPRIPAYREIRSESSRTVTISKKSVRCRRRRVSIYNVHRGLRSTDYIGVFECASTRCTRMKSNVFI